MMAKLPKKLESSTRDDADVRRGKIVDEAIRVIGQRGYHGFTVQELAQRCSLTNGGVLYHFGSKEKLLVAVLEERDRRIAQTITPASVGFPSRKSGPREISLTTTLQVLRLIIERCVTQPELVRLYAVLQSESLDHAHPAHDYFLRRAAMVLNEFAAMVAPHVAESRSMARQIHALMDGLSLQWLRERQGFDLVAEWDRAIARLLPQGERRALHHSRGRTHDTNKPT
jgi:AcrR family transcriptional regulator